jgi:hypothetical protein
MKTVTIRYAVALVLAGAAALGAAGYRVAQIQAAGQDDRQIAQYCVPRDESMPAQRLYCRDDRPDHVG